MYVVLLYSENIFLNICLMFFYAEFCKVMSDTEKSFKYNKFSDIPLVFCLYLIALIENFLENYVLIEYVCNQCLILYV